MVGQRPAPEESDYFQADWLKPYEKLPALPTLKVYVASDYAVTADFPAQTTADAGRPDCHGWIVVTKLACGNGLRWSLEMETNGISPNRK
jgi:hypothetical protein